MTSEIIAQAFLICQDESRQLLVPFLYWCRCYNQHCRLSPNWSTKGTVRGGTIGLSSKAAKLPEWQPLRFAQQVAGLGN